jgi:hypothetical protein
VFEKSSLTTAIAYYFEKQAEGTPDGAKIRAVPSLEGIRGTLQACEDQTSAFDWRKYVVAVGTALGLTESNMYRTRTIPLMLRAANSSIRSETMPSFIFRALVNMLPLVQHFPEDRIIDLRTKHGVCSIIVWARTSSASPSLLESTPLREVTHIALGHLLQLSSSIPTNVLKAHQ